MKVVQFTIPVLQDSTLVVQDSVLPHYYNHLHRHREVQIEWVVEGTGMLIAGNYMQRFETGDIYIIGANQSHIFKSDEAYFDPEAFVKVHSVSIFFDPGALSASLLSLPEMSGLRRFTNTLHHGFKVPEPFLRAVQDNITAVLENKDSLRLASFITLLHSFASIRTMIPLATNNAEQVISEVEGIRMDRIFQYLVSGYKHHITLDEISEVANLTPQAFCRYFKKHTDKTFIQFLNEVRVNEACKVILSGRFDSFSEISYQTGFDNVTNFNRVFKKMVGRSPGSYLKEISQKLS